MFMGEEGTFRQWDNEMGRLGRIGELAFGERPCFGVVLHVHEHGDDLIVFGIEGAGLIGVGVAAFDGKLEPRLSLGSLAFGIVELADKRRCITALTPSFGDVCCD